MMKKMESCYHKKRSFYSVSAVYFWSPPLKNLSVQPQKKTAEISIFQLLNSLYFKSRKFRLLFMREYIDDEKMNESLFSKR